MVSYSALTDRSAVETAIAEFDELGRDEFLARYGFRRARDYFLVTDSGRYDSKAIFGVAYGIQHGVALEWSDFSGGRTGAARQLRELGFQVEGGDEGLADSMSFWWVNQGWTSDRNEDVRILWAPVKDAAGRAHSHWDSLELAEVGDTVLHYAHGYVMGASRVAEMSMPMPRPTTFERAGERAGDDGRLVTLDALTLFDIPVPLAAVPLGLRIQPGETSPFTSDGAVRNGFFFPITQEIAVAVFAAAQLVELDGEREDAEGDLSGMVLTLTETDGHAVVRVRREQRALSRALFGTAPTARCELCGRAYPVRYLRTAHIKPRRDCSLEERIDVGNVVMAACVFGCDAMFEDGLLHVDGTGRISIATGGQETVALAAFTASLDGRLVPGFTEGRKRYFEWRNAQRA